MSRYVSVKDRQAIRERANFVCEYCLAYEGFSFVKFQIEHIISIKHGGLSTLDNLALACFICNSCKGSDLGTFIHDDKLIRFFHPRKDKWSDHFELSGSSILPKTEIGKATIKILKLNDTQRLMERNALIISNNFPHKNALAYLE